MNIKKLVASVMVGGLLLTGIAAYAETANNNSPQTNTSYTAPRYGRTQMVDFMANLLGKSTDETLKLLNSGKTLQQIAVENGVKLEDFKTALLKAKTDYVDQMVKSGTITEERAAEIKSLLKERIDACDGTGYGGAGLGIGFGRSGMVGNGYGKGHGLGIGRNMQ
ncbi:alkyl sulfatase-like hydrolase [Thermoanaerobacterium thermosaccharolyticum]|uniref:Alkyl sulfatase-like hydrolase n=1 Tax=Thermoanaerobacterium thermosaccharolyticum M0795 TaxID=698948 RepID=L0INK5_THETR|nr:alkyl sulfatase-like hydrolase [Thermoanaerobacterium thermosaccharolyticum]AGB19577.1 alkyl sulfatase-like hydrolase [Thermoanaerobacterium thermosaccharolyticum M0795]